MTSPRAHRVRDVREEVMRLDGYPCHDRFGTPRTIVLPNDLEMDFVRRGARGPRHTDPADHVMLCPGHHRGTGKMAGYQWSTAHRERMRVWLDNGRR